MDFLFYIWIPLCFSTFLIFVVPQTMTFILLFYTMQPLQCKVQPCLPLLHEAADLWQERATPVRWNPLQLTFPGRNTAECTCFCLPLRINKGVGLYISSWPAFALSRISFYSLGAGSGEWWWNPSQSHRYHRFRQYRTWDYRTAQLIIMTFECLRLMMKAVDEAWYPKKQDSDFSVMPQVLVVLRVVDVCTIFFWVCSGLLEWMFGGSYALVQRCRCTWMCRKYSMHYIVMICSWARKLRTSHSLYT